MKVKLNVNVFKPSGKWYAGYLVEIDDSIKLGEPGFYEAIISQSTLSCVDPDFTWVVTHCDDYCEDDKQTFFYQTMVSGEKLKNYLTS